MTIQPDDSLIESIRADLGVNAHLVRAAFQKLNADGEANKKAIEAEKREREELELRFSRPGSGGGSEARGDLALEHKTMAAWARSDVRDFAVFSSEFTVKTMSVGSDPDGGYTVLPAMSATMATKLRDISPIRRLANIETIGTGDALEIVDDYDDVGATWTGEHEAPETDSPQLGKIRIRLDEITAQPKVTQRLLDDSMYDIGRWLDNKISEQFGIVEATAFIAGNGYTQPKGLVTYAMDSTSQADSSRNRGVVQFVKTGVAGGWPTASAFPGDVLLNTYYSLRAPYRQNSTWLMNSATALLVSKFKDSEGRYLWQGGLQAGTPALLLGRPVEFAEDMPATASGTYPVLFGDIRRAYTIVERPGLRMLKDPFTSKPYTKFYTTKRVGGGLVDSDAIKAIKVTN